MKEISKNLCNKSELIEMLAQKYNIPMQVATLALETIFDEIIASLVRGNRIEIRGLGSLEVRKYKSYQGRNPRNKKLITIPEKKLPFFKVGTLKDVINN